MSYIKKITKTTDEKIIRMEKYYSYKFRPSVKVPKEKRVTKRNLTPEWQQKANRRRAMEDIALKVLNNYQEGDYYLTFTYGQLFLPKEDKEERVKKDIRNILVKIKRRFEKAGILFKYIAMPENVSVDARGRVHFHCLIPAMPELVTNKQRENFFQKLWGKGNVFCKEYGGGAEDAFRLASYFKKQNKEDSGTRILMSHNLVSPKTTKEEVTSVECYSVDVNVPAGYEIVHELTYQCYTRDGFPCQHIVMQKIPDKTSKRKYSMLKGRYKS